MSEVSIRDARNLFLQRQGLLNREPFGRGKPAVLKAIDRLGYVQIDTISVVDRAHHHVLKTRVPNYSEHMLGRLMCRDRDIFEYWAHAAAYLPSKDYRYYLPMMAGWRNRKNWDKKLAREIRRRIEIEGPLQAKDFEDPRGRNSKGWWDWKPAKLALEHMFLSGELMVTRREGFQKVYDLTENVLPADVDTSMPSHEEWVRFLALRVLRAIGIGTLHDISFARGTISRFTGRAIRSDVKHALASLAEDHKVETLTMGKQTWYADPTMTASLPIQVRKRRLHILSPFDNVVINRSRTIELFGFDYQLECYVPAQKRRFGYFCLPMLWGNEFIGRVDARAARKRRVLEIKCLFLEPDTRLSDRLIHALGTGLTDFAQRNQCETVEIARTEPSSLASAIEPLLA